MHIPAIQHRVRRVRTREGPALACGCGVYTRRGAVCVRGGAAHTRGRGAHNINRNTVTWDSLDGEFIKPDSQKVSL